MPYEGRRSGRSKVKVHQMQIPNMAVPKKSFVFAQNTETKLVLDDSFSDQLKAELNLKKEIWCPGYGYTTIQGHGDCSKKILDGLKKAGFEVLQNSIYSDKHGTMIEHILDLCISKLYWSDYCDFAISEILECFDCLTLNPIWGINKAGTTYILNDLCFKRILNLYMRTRYRQKLQVSYIHSYPFTALKIFYIIG